MQVTFDKERETKNTVRYTERVGDEPPVLGTVYVQKYVINKLGNPASIVVTIEAGS